MSCESIFHFTCKKIVDYQASYKFNHSEAVSAFKVVDYLLGLKQGLVCFEMVAKRPSAAPKCLKRPAKKQKANDSPAEEIQQDEELTFPPGEEVQEPTPTQSDEVPETSLTAKQLMTHQNFITALEQYKNGRLSEDQFLSKWTQNQRQGFCKMMEQHRKDNNIEGWDELHGAGAKLKKKKFLLQFLATGKVDQSEVSQITKGINTMNNDKTNQWVSWKIITDQYGEEEAKLRLQNGLLKARKDPDAKAKGLNIWQFLKVEEKTKFKQGIQQETDTKITSKASAPQVQCMATALMDAAESPQLLDDLWQSKKVSGDYKQTWKALEPDAMLALQDEDDDTDGPEEDILAKMGLASSSRPKNGGKTKEEKEKEAEEKKQKNWRRNSSTKKRS